MVHEVAVAQCEIGADKPLNGPCDAMTMGNNRAK
jgi:hypothetical protein